MGASSKALVGLAAAPVIPERYSAAGVKRSPCIVP